MREPRAGRGDQTASERLSGERSPSDTQRGENPHYQCQNRGSFFPGNDAQNWHWWECKNHPASRPTRENLQTALHRMANRDERSNLQRDKETQRQRILLQRRQSYSQVGMDLPGCRPDYSPVQRRQSWHTELLSVCRQLETVGENPIYPRI